MIYSDEFVWLHFPKCAGTKIERIFSKYLSNEEGITQDIVNFKKDPLVKWHDTIALREKRDPHFKLGSRVIIFPIRRLPGWLASRYNFEVNRSPDLPHNPELLLKGNYLNQDGSIDNANNAIRKFLSDQLLKSNEIKFIRVEYFEADFKEIFGKFVDISKIPDTEFAKKDNVSKNCISEIIRSKLHDPKNNLYEICPYWKMIEDIAYNHLPYTSSFSESKLYIKQNSIREINVSDKNNQTQEKLPLNDKQADVFRNKAIEAIKQGDWEYALENLKSAYLIRPHGPYIRLYLINALVQLERFDEISPHIDFLNNPPKCFDNSIETKQLLNKLSLIVLANNK